MFENYYSRDNTRIYRCNKCDSHLEGYSEMCSTCLLIQDEENRCFKDHVEREEQSRSESNPWIAFYSHIMGECRELGIKPWGDGHPATWASAQYHARKNHETQQDEGHIDNEQDVDTVSCMLIAIDIEAFDNVGGVDIIHDEDYIHRPPNDHEVKMSYWRKHDFALKSKFHVPPYEQAIVTKRNRYGQVEGWRVEMAA